MERDLLSCLHYHETSPVSPCFDSLELSMFSRAKKAFMAAAFFQDPDGLPSASNAARSSHDATSAAMRALSLPEILLRVGQYLQEDLTTIISCMLVSQDFHRTFSSIRWHNVCLRVTMLEGKDTAKRRFVLLVRNLYRIRCLTVENWDFAEDDDVALSTQRFMSRLMDVLSAWLIRPRPEEEHRKAAPRGLRRLKLHTAKLSMPLQATMDLLPMFGDLQELDIGVLDNAHGGFRIQRILDIFPRLVSLRIVCSPTIHALHASEEENEGAESELTDTPGLCREDDKAASAMKLPLRRLCLMGIRCPAQTFIRFVKQCPNMNDLMLVGQSRLAWDWTEETIDQLARSCPEIDRIHIDPGYGSSFSDNLLARLLESLRRLKTLRIPRCDLGEMTVSALRRHMPYLQELNVAFTRKPGMTGAMLVNLLSAAVNLRVLDASGVSLDPWQFTFKTAGQVSGGTRANTPWACLKLETISIGFATLHMSTRGCLAIYASLAQLKWLREIRILPNHLPITFEAGLEQLSCLKDLTHFDVHGTEKVVPEHVVKWMGRTWLKLQVLRLYLDGMEDEGSGMSGASLVKHWLYQVGRSDVDVQTD